MQGWYKEEQKNERNQMRMVWKEVSMVIKNWRKEEREETKMYKRKDWRKERRNGVDKHERKSDWQEGREGGSKVQRNGLTATFWVSTWSRQRDILETLNTLALKPWFEIWVCSSRYLSIVFNCLLRNHALMKWVKTENTTLLRSSEHYN